MTSPEADPLHILWLIYRSAIVKHLESAESHLGDTEAAFRERAEKAGIVAVVNATKKALAV
jgi:hypothetical protein